MSIYFVILYFISFLILIFVIRNKNSKSVQLELVKIQNLNLKLNKFLSSVKCETFISGSINTNYLFRVADLYFYENAFLIIGYFKVGKYKFYKSALLLSNDESLINNTNIKVISPRKLNINSFNKDVYIEFVESIYINTSIEIRLTNLKEEDKLLIKI